ncbi:MAG: flavodoxin [Muribaculaceae bacterium]|nr:flavodoxin [Muribaculaceae bacterium]MCF0214746.1 flavodoxin [Muribaculaceae bacterium]
MNRIGIFYGSSTGTTEKIAHRIASLLDVPERDVHNVADTMPHIVGDYNILICGAPTWGGGDLQNDWYDFLTGMKALDLRNKKTALFGLGDEVMTETFCNAVGTLHNELAQTGTQFIGAFPDGVYDFRHSTADEDGVAVGLLLDEANHPELTEERLKAWSEEIRKQIA